MKEWKKIRSGLKWKNIFVLTLAGCINAFGVTIFLMPVKLYDSGISGTSMLLSQITPSWLSLPVFLIGDTFNRVVFESHGYTIGLGDRLLHTIHQL